MGIRSLSIFFATASLVLGLASCNSEDKTVFVDHNDPHLVYEGRVDTTQADGVQLYWSGTSIKLNFKGTSISAYFKDSEGDNYYDIRIDNDSVRLIRPDTTRKEYVLATNLSPDEHTVEIFKRTEWNRGTTTFYGFQLKGDGQILSSSPSPARKIEFYGNSISAGYAVEDYSGRDLPDSTYTNNYYSYAALTARHFEADYRCICRSGIGVTISWDPPIMPEIYDRLAPQDSTSRWDFSQYTPDLVVVNLFQNDSWLVNMPDHPQFKRRFGEEAPSEETLIAAYQEFVSKLRKHYPEAYIVCALGSMDATKEGSKWPDYVQTAVQSLNDERIGVLLFPFINTDNHPNKEQQESMAWKLIAFINEKVGWEQS
ncbi:SGNH/GDSL hydrolase family protein [Flagellimonas amoyensis]|uniref:SGNH/GDSL hydrolase family protein n=1 Tax=Flagellimonas amoyensis TaxID=2169401 RepID=UPI000D358EBB|nr:SGNH/GDSL hydrolase family protein [Allomuricauda amoyensis]